MTAMTTNFSVDVTANPFLQRCCEVSNYINAAAACMHSTWRIPFHFMVTAMQGYARLMSRESNLTRL